MTRRANYAAVAWAVILAITLAACGSDSTPTGAQATTANITFKTDPAASVWIDGENKGVTPIVIAVAAGSRDVILKAEGFEDMQETITVEAGKDLTVDTGLMLAGTDVADYKRLLATLGIEHEGYGEAPKAHRGYGDKAVMLYWPQGTMRKSALRTYRIEVTPDYADDGYIVFRQGKREIHREKFEAQDLMTEKALPASVMEALKAGEDFTWGIYYDSKRKKPEIAKFEVASRSKERSFDKKLSKIKRRKAYQRLNPVMRAMANVDLLQNNRLYSEALSHSLSMVNTWPDTEMPFKSIAFCLQRLKLKDTSLYEAVGESLRGGGRFTPKKTSLSGSTDLGHRKGGQSSSIPTPLVAPRVRERAGGLSAGGGMAVTPTPDAQKRKPGPIVPEPTEEGDAPSGAATDPRVRPDAPRGSEQAEELSKQLEAAQDALQAAKDATAAMEAAQQKLHDLSEEIVAKEAATASAQSALEALQAQEAATPGSVSAADLQAANEALSAATEQAEQARLARDAAQVEADKLTSQMGSAGNEQEAQERVDALRRQLERVIEREAQANPATGPNPVPGASTPNLSKQLDAAQDALQAARDATTAMEQAQQNLHRLAEEIVAKEAATASAQSALEALQAQEAATPGSVSAADLQAANEALSAATEQAEQARLARDAAQVEADKLTSQMGSAGNEQEAQERVDALRRQLEKEIERQKSLSQANPTPGLDPATGARGVRDLELKVAQLDVADATNAAEAGAQWFQAAQSAAATAESDLAAAEAALQAKVEAGAPETEIQVVEEAMSAANAEVARSQMELERARAARETADRALAEAEAMLERVEAGKPLKK